MQSEAPSAFDTHHDDVIHDAQVDFFGRRLATASSDRTVRIFQINQNQTETLMSILSGHEGPVWQVAWAHPKFGSILASCSYDGSVIIWQEEKSYAQDSALHKNYSERTHSSWSKLKVHKVHESSVNSISFAPHEYGLHLACAGSDGKISVLSQSSQGEWTCEVFAAHQSGCNSVSWCPSSKPSSLLSLDFDSNRVDMGPLRLASGGCDNNVKLWLLSGEPKLEATLQGHDDWVRDVCWRPNNGQNGHLLVSCSQDCRVLLWNQNSTGDWSKKFLTEEPFPDTLWRASFSEYGNLLAISCGDNTVTIWREVAELGNWEQVGTVDESVTEPVKISEPLAVEPPASAPIPELEYTTQRIMDSQDQTFQQEHLTDSYIGPELSQSIIDPGTQEANEFQAQQEPVADVDLPSYEPVQEYGTEYINESQNQYSHNEQYQNFTYENEYLNESVATESYDQYQYPAAEQETQKYESIQPVEYDYSQDAQVYHQDSQTEPSQQQFQSSQFANNQEYSQPDYQYQYDEASYYATEGSGDYYSQYQTSEQTYPQDGEDNVYQSNFESQQPENPSAQENHDYSML